jgi:hypothetical protein
MSHGNRAPTRGSKLRYQGDKDGNTVESSAEMDWPIGGTSNNARPRMSESEQHPTNSGSKLRGDTGLIFKEPLS